MTSLSEAKKHNYCQKAIEMEGIARGVYLTLGEMLYNIREEQMYEPHWSSWNEYCMEFKDFSQGSISKMISVYEVFILKYSFSPLELTKAGGWTKLYAMTPFIKSKADAKHWLGISSTLNRSDLTKELVEASTGVSMKECEHEDTFVFRVCKTCGEKWKVIELKT